MDSDSCDLVQSRLNLSEIGGQCSCGFRGMCAALHVSFTLESQTPSAAEHEIKPAAVASIGGLSRSDLFKLALVGGPRAMGRGARGAAERLDGRQAADERVALDHAETQSALSPTFTEALYNRAMPISARNKLRGKMEEIQLGDVMAHVVVRVGEKPD
jgi:hypothetical protein